MTSGRFRTEHLSRHWSDNPRGYCQADTCHETTGDLEHLLVHCPALLADRERLWTMFFAKSVKYPALLQFLLYVDRSPANIKMQFLLDPLAFSEISEFSSLFGPGVISHIYYLIRTYVYYIYRRKQIIIGTWEGEKNSTWAKN